jgi:HEAT repeat protein
MNERTLWEKYHIASTKEGLIGALEHPEGTVRGFAASKLAAEGQKDAVPAILVALAKETVPGVRISLALAAARLGSDDGIAALRTKCRDRTRATGLRMMAASAMLDLGREDCLTDVLEGLRSAENGRTPIDDQDIMGALYMTPRFKNPKPEQAEETKALVAMALQSDTPIVRSVAANYTIPRMADNSWAVEQLQGVLAVERDENVRKTIQAALEKLEAK